MSNDGTYKQPIKPKSNHDQKINVINSSEVQSIKMETDKTYLSMLYLMMAVSRPVAELLLQGKMQKLC